MPIETGQSERAGAPAPIGYARPRSADVARLRERVAGQVLVPADPAYAAAHLVWNRDRQCRPAVIVRPASGADVVAGVRFAREQELPIAARGGGYGPSGSATCEGGVVLDLRSIARIGVDPLGRTAVAQAGAAWGSVDTATQEFGYAVPGVPLSGVGIAGSTLGGGFGHLRRAYGLACDNLTSADLVTADGDRITASGDEHPELLWGLRGGGGNFGIVTSLSFRLHPLPEPVLSGTLIYPGERAEQLLRFYRDYTLGLGDDVTTQFSLLGGTRSLRVAKATGRMTSGPVVAITVACAGHPVAAEALVRPLRTAGPVLADLVRAQPYPQLQASSDEYYRPGSYAVVGSDYVDAIDDDLVTVLAARLGAMPHPSCDLHLHHMGGAVGRVARMSTAVPNRGARFLLSSMTRWTEDDDEAAHRRWLRETQERVRPHSVGGPHVGLHSAPVSSVEAYGAERYLRLAALKRHFDPDNVFTGNQNVAPLA